MDIGMKYTVLTLFPEIIDAYFDNSIIAKAIQRGIISYKAINIRDYATDKHKTCDDAPYGGGPGMLMLPEPLCQVLEAVGVKKRGTRDLRIGTREQGLGTRERSSDYHNASEKYSDTSNNNLNSPVPSPQSLVPYTIYLTPSGKPFNQDMAKRLAMEEELVLVCGRYEGIDQRIIDLYIDEEVSVGDYVLSSGDVAALALIDATYRLVDKVITPQSLEEESFSGGLLEYPQYTRPEIFDNIKVPEVLLSGHHEKVRRWRLEKRIEKTLRNRPDLIRQGRELGYFNKEINSIIDNLSVEGDTEK